MLRCYYDSVDIETGEIICLNPYFIIQMYGSKALLDGKNYLCQSLICGRFEYDEDYVLDIRG